MALATKIRGSGRNDGRELQVDPAHLALRASIRPIDPGVGGSYSIALTSGLMAAGLAAASPIFSWRWAPAAPGSVCLIRKVRLTADTDATAFAQGSTIFTLTRAQQFTAMDTGGAVLSLKGKDQARSTRFPASTQQIAATATGVIAIATTATLVAGTRTLDTNPMHALVGGAGASPAIALVPPPGFLIDPTEAARMPLELGLNEGFVIAATVPATGTWKFAVEVDWDEIDLATWTS